MTIINFNKNKMKKIVTLLFLAMTLVSTAQESVLLRLNYSKGDTYLIEMNMKQNMAGGAMVTDMKMDMSTVIKDVKGKVFDTQMKFQKMVMNMGQGTMQMSYDSSKKEEDLDEMGKQLSTRFGPILKASFIGKMNNLGKVLEMKVEPSIPGANEMASQSNGVEYPEEAVKVGSSWIVNKEQQGMKTDMTYTVKSITATVVTLDLVGKITGVGEGTLSGSVEVDRKSGVPTKSVITSDMSAMGQKIKSDITVLMKKA